MLRYGLPLVVIVAVLGLLFVGLGIDTRTLPSPLVGRDAPAFEMEELRDPGRTLTEADLKGGVSLFNVFASWCYSCRAEHPYLLEMAKQGVTIYGLNYKDTRRDAERYLRSGGGDPYEWIGFDPEGRVGIEWGVYGTPETFVVDRHGVSRFKHVGPLHPRLIEEKILPLVAELEAES